MSKQVYLTSKSQEKKLELFLKNVFKRELIKVEYLSPSNYRGSRVKLTVYDFDHKRISITLDYNYNYAYTLDIAKAFLTQNGCEILATFEHGDAHYISAISEVNK